MSNVVKLSPVKSPVKSTTEPVKPTVKRRLNDVSPSEWDRVSCKYVTIIEKKWKKSKWVLDITVGICYTVIVVGDIETTPIKSIILWSYYGYVSEASTWCSSCKMDGK